MNKHLKVEPWERQKEGIKSLTSNDRHILNAGPGSGKTYAALASYANELEKDPKCKFVVVGNKSSIPSWKKDIQKTDFKLQVYAAGVKSPSEYQGQDVQFFMYNTVQRYNDILMHIYSNYNVILLFDEIHYLRNQESNPSKAASHMRDHSKKVWGMTGTVFTNNIENVYTLCEIIKPGFFGEKENFLLAYTRRKPVKIVRPVIPGKTRIWPGLKTFRRGAKTYAQYTVYEIVEYKNQDQLRRKLKTIMTMIGVNLDIRFHYRKVSANDVMDLYLQTADGILSFEFKEFAHRVPELQMVVNNAVLENRIPNRNNYLSFKERDLLILMEEKLNLGEGTIVFSACLESVDRLKFIIHGNREKLAYENLYIITGATTGKAREKISSALKPRDVVIISAAGGQSPPLTN